MKCKVCSCVLINWTWKENICTVCHDIRAVKRSKKYGVKVKKWTEK